LIGGEKKSTIARMAKSAERFQHGPDNSLASSAPEAYSMTNRTEGETFRRDCLAPGEHSDQHYS
jgi:hypothetical protein